MSTTPNDHIVYHAYQWRETDKRVIGAKEGEKEAARQAHRRSERGLRNAVDLAIRRGAPVIERPEPGVEP